jgi:hypothetical protein
MMAALTSKYVLAMGRQHVLHVVFVLECRDIDAVLDSAISNCGGLLPEGRFASVLMTSLGRSERAPRH